MSRKNNSRKLAQVRAAARAGLRGDGSTVPAPAQRWVCWLAPLLVALVTLAAFLPRLRNQFVNWDDDQNFLENPSYRGLAWTHLRWMWTTLHMGHYIPLTWMTLGLDHLLWGMNPIGYHLTSLLLHATNAVVFYLLARRLLTLALPGAAERGHALAASAGFAALVFAIHPLRVESVTWVTERRDVLSGLFYLVTIVAYLRACERKERGRWWYSLSVALLACALLSKSMAVTLPVVLLILDVYPLRRLGGSIGWSSEPARRVYAEKIPFVLLAAAAAVPAFKAQFLLHGMVSLAQLSGLGRLSLSAYGVSFYLWKMVAPLNLSPLYALPPTVNPWTMPFILSYGAVLAITAIALALRRRLPGLLAAWLAYVATLLPVLGVFQNGPQITADRYTYLAGFGWAILAGAGLLSCLRTRIAFPLAGVATCVVVALGVLTWNQVRVWHDSGRLWTHALTVDPNSPIAQNNFGSALARQGRLAEATEHYQEAVRIKRDYALAHNNWGEALVRQGKPAEAIEHFQEALRIEHDFADAHNSWGAALLRQGELAEAVGQLLPVLHLAPEILETAGLALDRQGKLAEAIEHFQEALRIKPDDALAHNNWGLALLRQGTPAAAIEHFQQALRLKPDLAEAHVNLGRALTQQGKVAEATEHYQQAQGQKAE